MLPPVQNHLRPPPPPDSIDTNELLQRFCGNQELLQSLVEMFPEESAKLLAAMKAARSANDAAGVYLNAHTLKGTCKMFAATGAAALAADLECAASAGCLGTDDQVNKLCVEVGRAIEAVKRLQAAPSR
jgi:HPt (histidine-containing phosphotransfer) domain-containing protein